MIKKILSLFIIFIVSYSASIKAQDSFKSISSGNWEDVNIWNIVTGYTVVQVGPGQYIAIPIYGAATAAPTSIDDVIIDNNHVVTINSAAAATYIYVYSTDNATVSKLIVSSTNSLTTDTLFMYPASTGISEFENNGTTTTVKTILYDSDATSISTIINNSTIVASTTEITEASGGAISIINNSGATYTTGDITTSNTNPSNTTIDLSSGNGILNLSGNLIGSNITLNAGSLGSIVDYNGTAAQTINASFLTFDNLNISNAVGASLDAPITASNLIGDLTTNSGSILNLNGNSLTVVSNINNNGTINANANINLTGNFLNSGTFTSTGSTINLEGNWNNTGTYTYQTGDSVVFDGTITGSTITGVTDFDELVINQPGLTTNVSSGSVGVASYLTVAAGTLNVAPAAAVTLYSNGTKTAQLVEMVAGADYTGDLIVQRDLSVGTDDWREITSPVAGTTLADWQDDGLVFTGFTGAPYNGSNWYSFINTYTYTEANAAGVKYNGWVAATNITNPTSFTRGHRIYMGSTTAPTISVKGAPNKNSQTANVTYSGSVALEDGWNLIGNPYPCTIDWNTLTTSNIEASYWIYNGTAGNYGVYQTNAGTGTNGVDNQIAHSQAFWVHATAATGSVSFVESNKIRSDKAFVKSNSSDEYVRLKLSGAVNSYYDEAIITFNTNASESYDYGIDQSKLYTNLEELAPSLAIVTLDNKDLSIAGVNELESRTIPLKAFAGTTAYGTYTIEFELPSNSLLNSCITLEDLETGTITNLKTVNSYSFTTTANSPQERFLLHIANPFETVTLDPTCSNLTDGAILIEGGNVTGNTFTLTNSTGVVNTIVASSNQVSFENLTNGLYTITSSQASACGYNSIDVSLNVPIQVIASFNLADNVIYLDQNSTITPQNTSTGTNYTWDFGDGNISFDENPSHFYSEPGIYIITLTVESSGCEISTTKTIEVMTSTGIDELNNFSFNVITTDDNLIVTMEKDFKKGLIQLTTINGKLVYKNNLNTSKAILNTQEYAKGIYLITVITKESQTTQKVVIK